ncbi:MAG: flagellar basal body-associated FliL family protein [Pontiellaceae bacterium]|nr:flagellar basal body-associated FliL family protein [Pontiellaceae bacterium]MBN2784123.1 flagellar basal body-associated FliL family protein [Pontiellaceae bacterium]
MAEQNDKTIEVDGEGAPKKGKGMIIIIVIGVVLIAGGVGAGMMLGMKNKPQPTKKVEAPIILEFQDVFVNVAETKATRVLKLTPVLELSEAKLGPLLEAERPIIRDLISETASKMTIDELEGQNGREILKREIKNKINDLANDWMAGAVVKVYFSDFLIQ